MKLLTKEIINKLPKLYANDGKEPKDVPIIVKFFNPCGAATWYITEGQEQSEEDYDLLSDGSKDWLFYGWCDLGYGGELGYVLLSDLLSVKGRLGLGIERDRHFDGKTLADVIK